MRNILAKELKSININTIPLAPNKPKPKRKMLKKPFNQLFNGDQKILEKLKINLNLRPQNLDFDTYYKLTIEYEKLKR